MSPSGTIYVSDGNKLRAIQPNGTVSSVPGTYATFYPLGGLAVDSFGNVIVADTSNNLIRKVYANGTVVTLAGNGNAGYVDGAAAGGLVQLNHPAYVAVNANGDIVVTESSNVRLIVSPTL